MRHELVGCFVVEVGERQAWPFLTFCDNSTTPSRERRLYIDTAFNVDHSNTDATRDAALARLLPLNNLTVEAVDIDKDALAITFDGGHRLQVSSEGDSTTTQDSWWFSRWNP